MEVLKDQIDIFGVLDKEVKVEKKVVLKSVNKSHKNKSERNSETEVLEGQITAFELFEDEKEEAISNFTDGQLKTIEQLKTEKEWVEYSLYGSGRAILITKENNIKIVPQADTTKKFTFKERHRSYIISLDGNIELIGIGVTKWNDPVKTVKKENENDYKKKI